MDGSEMVAQLPDWDADEHPHLGTRTIRRGGNGMLLWFATDDFHSVVEHARRAGVEVLDGPLLNENAQQREIWLSGPEGYVVVVAGPRGM